MPHGGKNPRRKRGQHARLGCGRAVVRAVNEPPDEIEIQNLPLIAAAHSAADQIGHITAENHQAQLGHRFDLVGGIGIVAQKFQRAQN